MYARQGDLIIDRCDKAPVALALQEAPVVIAGSHDGTHTVPAGVAYARSGRTHYVLPQADCELKHASRHRPIPLVAGQLYAIWPQLERRGDGDVDVDD